MYETITEPSQELVISTEQVKSYLRISGNGEDPKIRSIILAASEWIERLTGRIFLHQVRKLNFFKVKKNRLEIAIKPLIEIREVKIGGEISRDYSFSGGYLELPGSVLGKDIEITAEFGYGVKPESVPELLRHAVLMAATFYYEANTFPPLDHVNPIINTFCDIRI